MAELPPFEGFPTEGLDFLRGLEADNSKTYFDRYRKTYTNGVAGPAKSLVVDLGLALREEVDGALEFGPRTGQSLFRINRDTRFSPDKTPYKPRVDCVFWQGTHPRKSPSFFLRVTPDHVWLGSGIMHPEKSQLHAYREAVAATASGETLAALLNDLDGHSDIAVVEASRVRVPRGFKPDHPRERWLRTDGIHAFQQSDTPPEVHRADFVDWCVERYRPFVPLFRWVVSAMAG